MSNEKKGKVIVMRPRNSVKNMSKRQQQDIFTRIIVDTLLKRFEAADEEAKNAEAEAETND
jgi:hypothetical protein